MAKLKYGKKICREICQFIEDGLSNKDAAQLAGVSESTFYQWLKDYSEFSECIKKSQVKRKAFLIKKIFRAAQSSWQAAAWYLERVYSDEFAIKRRFEGNLSVNIQRKVLKEVHRRRSESSKTRLKIR
jgi:transposase